MSLQTVSSIVIIVGSLMFIFAAAPMSGIYGEKSLEDRLAKITANRNAFILSQVGFGLGSLITGVGYLLLSIDLRDSQNVLSAGAAAALIAGAGLWAFFTYQRTKDPASIFGDYLGSRIMWASFAFTEIGLVLYGIVFLQSTYPDWLGYTSLVSGWADVHRSLDDPQVVAPTNHLSADAYRGYRPAVTVSDWRVLREIMNANIIIATTGKGTGARRMRRQRRLVGRVPARPVSKSTASRRIPARRR